MFNESLWRTYSGVYSESLKKHFLLDVCSTFIWYFMNYIYIYILVDNVYFHTPLIWSCIICRHFRNTCSENFKFSSSHIWHPGWHLTYRYYKESIVCRRALLVGLPVFDVIDQITYLRLSIIILEIFRGVTNSWLKSCRTLMWVECGYKFYWETPRTIK